MRVNLVNEKVLWMFAGPNGSGKSTFANQVLLENPGLKFLNSDNISREKNVSPTEAGRILISQMREVFSENISFALETTLAGHFYKRTMVRARDLGYTILFLYVFLPSVEQNIARVRQRVALGGHDVPADIIRRRYYYSLKNFDTAYKLADQWELYDNGGASYQLVAHGIHDQVNVVNSSVFDEFRGSRANALSKDLLELANRGAVAARQEAFAAGVPVVLYGH